MIDDVNPVTDYLAEGGYCTCAAERMYQKEWEVKTGRHSVYVPEAIRCTVHYGELSSYD